MSERVSTLDKWPGKSAKDIKDAYRENVDKIEKRSWLIHLQTGRYRRHQFSDVEERVLDVACGTGENFRHYPDSADVVGIDITAEMLAVGSEEADDVEAEIDLQQMDAQGLSFDDDSFDTVVSSFSTCTFPDPIEALDEMERVCKSDGRIILLEHGKMDFWPIAKYQEWKADSEYEEFGCRLLDDPAKLVEQSNMVIEETESWQLGMLTGITAHPNNA